jgi:hypothetical protein
VVTEVAREKGVGAAEDESERQEAEEQTLEAMAAVIRCRRRLRHEGTAVPIKALAGCRGSWNAVFRHAEVPRRYASERGRWSGSRA